MQRDEAADLGRPREVATALARRWPTWLAVGLSALTLGGGGTDQGVRGLSEALLILPLEYLVVAALGRREASWGVVVVGVTGFVVLRAVDVVPPAAVVVALAGLAVDPDLGRHLVAAGWFLHGVWDLVHLRADKVVARSYAEWCGVVDVLIAAQLVLGV
jgi:hypothetical protein